MTAAIDRQPDQSARTGRPAGRRWNVASHLAEESVSLTTARGRLVVLEGPDGIGKTTLAEALADLTYEQACALGPDPSHGLVFVPRRQISATSSYAANVMGQLANVLWHSGDSPDLPDAFWVPLQAAWYAALRSTVLDPLLAAGHDVIMDGWWFKFFSKLRLQGYTDDTLDVIFERVEGPDAVILLTGDLGALFDRRDDFQPRELGMHAGLTDLGRDTFITYQRDGLRLLHGYAARFGWPVADLDVTAPVDDTLRVVAPLVDHLLTATEGTRR